MQNPLDSQAYVALVLGDVRRAIRETDSAISYSEHINDHQDIIDDLIEQHNKLTQLETLLTWFEGTLPKPKRE